MIEKLVFIMNVCLVLGFAVPLLDVALGFFGSLTEIDFDIGGHHIGDMFDFGGGDGADAGNVLPFNLMCLCFALVVFGAAGRLTVPLMVSVWAAAGCLLGLAALSAAAYALLFKFVVKPLKKNNPRAIEQWDLFGEKGKLTLRITAESAGTVSLRDSTGASISYAARAAGDVLETWEGMIPQGAEVIVVNVDEANKTLFVKPANTLENLRLRHPQKNT